MRADTALKPPDMSGEQDLSRSLLELGRSLFGTLDLDVVLGRVLAAAVDLTGARYAALGVVDGSGTRLQRFLTVGLDAAEHVGIGDLPRGHGVLGVLIADPRPLRLSDVGGHPRSYGFPLGHPPMHGFLGVPIVIAGEVFGSLYLTEKTGVTEFSAQDERVTVALADWAAIAIENARCNGELQRERDELARRVRAFETTEAVAQALAGETELERILELIVKRGRALAQARAMVLVMPQGAELVVMAMAGETDRSLLGMRVPIDGSLTGHVYRTGRTSRWVSTASVAPRSWRWRRAPRRRWCSRCGRGERPSASCRPSIDSTTVRTSAATTSGCWRHSS